MVLEDGDSGEVFKGKDGKDLAFDSELWASEYAKSCGSRIQCEGGQKVFRYR